MNKYEYTEIVEMIKENIKSEKVRKAILQLIARSEEGSMTLALWFPWEEETILYEDDWEDFLEVYFCSLNKCLYLEGAYIRLRYYGGSKFDLLTTDPYSWTGREIDISEIEEELNDRFNIVRYDLIEEIKNGERTPSNPDILEYLTWCDKVWKGEIRITNLNHPWQKNL